MAFAATSSAPPFRFVSDDNFTRRIDSYDGRVITCSDSKLPTYEVGSYLGGGVAGVVYKGKRLRPAHEYPPARVSARGAFYPNDEAAGGTGAGARGEAPAGFVAMTTTSISPSSIRRISKSSVATSETGTGLFAVLCRAALPERTRPASVVQPCAAAVAAPASSNESEDGRSALGGGMPAEGTPETVAIKMLNPLEFRLLDPEMLQKPVIVREGFLPRVEADGSFKLREEHVWWIVDPNSQNLRSLLRHSHGASNASASRGSSPRASKADDASEESSPKSQGSLTQSFGVGGNVDRGSPERGLRLSLVATYVDPCIGALRELPLPRCVEIWGHPPFAATDGEFEAMMEVLLRLNAGGSSGLREKSSSKNEGTDRQTQSGRSNAPDSDDTLASRRAGAEVFCPALSAYITVPIVPPKYIRWLKQRRLATNEVRNMMRIGRHRNVVYLYEVLEMVQDSKSTMFLILELVRGGELFDLISSNSSSRRKKDSGATACEHEITARKFFEELASGINFIHSCGMAHHDLRPENVLIQTKSITKDGNNMFDGVGDEEWMLKIADFGSALPLSPQRCGGSPIKSGKSPLLNRACATALSMLTCGITNVCLDDRAETDNLVDDDEQGGSDADLWRMTSVLGTSHYWAPEIIAQAHKLSKENGGGVNPPDWHAARAGCDGTKADVWSAGVILYAMLFLSLPFGGDLLRCPRYQAFRKWYGNAQQLQPPITGKQNRRAHPDCALDPNYDKFDKEEMLGPHWFFPCEISAPGRDLILAMLNPNPHRRLTAEMVLRHPWLRALRGGVDDGRVDDGREVASGMSTIVGLCMSGTICQ